MDPVTSFGVVALTFMMMMYALEKRSLAVRGRRSHLVRDRPDAIRAGAKPSGPVGPDPTVDAPQSGNAAVTERSGMSPRHSGPGVGLDSRIRFQRGASRRSSPYDAEGKVRDPSALNHSRSLKVDRPDP
jgi:hypothetical protein